MKRPIFARGRRYAMVASLLLASFVPLRADEAPANKQDPTPLGVTVGLDYQPVDLSTAQFALSAIHLATNADLIGADVAQVDEVVRSHLGLGEGKGLVVTAVRAGTPAAKAGVQKNDVLIVVGSEEIAGLETFRKSLEASTDKPVSITLIRAGKKQAVDVTPRSDVVATELLSHAIAPRVAEPKYWLGVGLAGADDTLRSQLSLAAGEGLVVTNVENDSPAGKAGVLVNDLLLKLHGKSLTTIEALAEQLQTIADKSVSLELLRRGKPAMLTVTPEKHAEAVAAGLSLFAENHWVNPYNIPWVDPNNNIRWMNPYNDTQWVNLNNNIQWVYPNNNIQRANPYNPQAQTPQLNLAKQLNDLNLQVKQLEVAVAALRSIIEANAQSAQGNAEKK